MSGVPSGPYVQEMHQWRQPDESDPVVRSHRLREALLGEWRAGRGPAALHDLSIGDLTALSKDLRATQERDHDEEALLAAATALLRRAADQHGSAVRDVMGDLVRRAQERLRGDP